MFAEHNDHYNYQLERFFHGLHLVLLSGDSGCQEVRKLES